MLFCAIKMKRWWKIERSWITQEIVNIHLSAYFMSNMDGSTMFHLIVVMFWMPLLVVEYHRHQLEEYPTLPDPQQLQKRGYPVRCGRWMALLRNHWFRSLDQRVDGSFVLPVHPHCPSSASTQSATSCSARRNSGFRIRKRRRRQRPAAPRPKIAKVFHVSKASKKHPLAIQVHFSKYN